ncbi:polysaccharide pyruvyl transferase family protein [Marinilactibacillus sp. XAAS-LB27]|uniref:polysaccharide pyruvyl transferase family protein n=1 Tax=Marinilactibacillus sp. XAAS-LB27 TaxID=3114538 RepID=UPI002E186FE6|nr:polysaccharide pyruvyl transferase family protein [Marinilactibacillus sp. XAAS-LB27]
MKKKVGILTITDYGNYGNRLQNYATQEILKGKGFEVTTVKSRVGNQIEKSFKEKLKEFRPNDISRIIKNRMNNKKHAEVKSERYSKFVKFSKDNIKETPYTVTEEAIPSDIDQQFDYFVTGSDQVWNPNYRKGSGIDFLTFASKEKRIALSPSFGISTIPSEYRNKYSKMIEEMAHLSVREEAGAKIIKELTNREAEVLVDPTLVLEEVEWKKLSKKPNIISDKKYLLTYFLGPIAEKTQAFLDKVSSEKNLEIIYLHDLKRSPSYYSVDPSEFLYLIDHAELFCTDSFHGSIFSIVFKTPFVVCDRIENSELKMSSRIDTLLKKFSLSERHESQSLGLSVEEVLELNTSHIEDVLIKEREQYINYIDKALV